MKILTQYINEALIGKKSQINPPAKDNEFIEDTLSCILEIIKNDNTISITVDFIRWLRKQLANWTELTLDDLPTINIVLYCYSKLFYNEIISYLDEKFLKEINVEIHKNEYAAREDTAFSGHLKTYEDKYKNIDIKYNNLYFRISLKCGNIYFMKNCKLC